MREPRPSTFPHGRACNRSTKDDMPPTPTRSPAATAAVLPESPPGDVTAGLDWATADHAVAIVNHKGTITGLKALVITAPEPVRARFRGRSTGRR